MLRKGILAITASSILLLGAAHAADVMVKAPLYQAPVVAPAANWTGAYLGWNAGYGWADPATDVAGTATTLAFSRIFPPGVPSSGSFADSNRTRLNGFVGGLQVGYNYQFNRQFVTGFETDIQLADQRGRGALNDPFTVPFCTAAFPPGICAATTPMNNAATTVYEAKIRWFGTARGRLGVLFNDVLIYGTGGLAYGGVSVSGTTVVNGTSAFANPVVPGSTAFAVSKTNVGFSVGAGLEGRLTAWLSPNWTWKAEYLYVDLGAVNTAAAFPAAFITAIGTPFTGSLTTHTRFTDNIVRVGMNYKLN